MAARQAGGPYTGRGAFRYTSYAARVRGRWAAAQERAAERAARWAADMARSLCPVDTGFLRDSISHEVRRIGTGFAIVVLAGAEYALYVELGTSVSRAQPFLRPALDRLGPVYLQFLAEEMGRAA
jgi:HK97 gp10 family phage protein